MSPDMLESIREYREYHDRLNWSPPDFHRDLDAIMTGQYEAKRNASIALYNHLEGRPSVSLFYGSTGCGKSHLFYSLQKDFHFIYIFDCTSVSAEGWSGSTKLSSLLRTISSHHRNKAFLVFDEADKMFTPRYASGGGGWNTSLQLQEQFLKLLDGHTLYFGAERDSPAFSLDCSTISVVFLGAFTELRKRKANQKQPIGFNASSIQQESTADLSVQDFIDFGMMPELCGRIMRWVRLDDLSVQDYIDIGANELKNMEAMYKKPIRYDPSILVMLARMAEKEGLGARWMKHKLRIMIEDTTYYYDPLVDTITLTYQHDGPLPCIESPSL